MWNRIFDEDFDDFDDFDSDNSSDYIPMDDKDDLPYPSDDENLFDYDDNTMQCD